MGLFDFIMKRRQEKKVMKKKRVEKKKASSGKEKKPFKKKSIAGEVVAKKEGPKVLQKKEQKEVTGEWSIEEAKESLLRLKNEIFKTVSLKDMAEDTIQKEELFDEVDHTIEERQKELSLLLSEREKAKLNEIEEALQRIENKTYGICEECGDKISSERLKYLPYARYCVDCQDKVEKMEELSRVQPELSNIILPSGFPDVNEDEEM